MRLCLKFEWETGGAGQANAAAEVVEMAEGAVLAAAAADDAWTATAFQDWLVEYRGAASVRRAALVDRGRALLQPRRVRMARSISEDPEQSWRAALRFDEFETLPDAQAGQARHFIRLQVRQP